MTEDDKAVQAVRTAIKAAWSRYYVQGTTDQKFGGPPYRAPWFLIDALHADYETNYPGDLVAEYGSGQEAYDHRDRLVSKEAIAAYKAHLEAEGMVIVPLYSLQTGERVVLRTGVGHGTAPGSYRMQGDENDKA